MKKIITCILSMMGITWAIWICLWQLVFWPVDELSSKNPYTESTGGGVDTTGIWDLVDIKDSYIKEGKGNRTIIVRLLEVFWLDTTKENDHKFLDYARAIINMALWLVSFIALIMTIYTFYMMFFTDNDAWIKKAKWNLVGIFIALGILWLAWIVVSFIFWRYQSNWKEKENDIFYKDWTTSFNYNIDVDNHQIYLTV